MEPLRVHGPLGVSRAALPLIWVLQQGTRQVVRHGDADLDDLRFRGSRLVDQARHPLRALPGSTPIRDAEGRAEKGMR